MLEPPDHYRNLSLRLSEVLGDIGVNERLVMKRKRIWMLSETMRNMQFNIDNKPNMQNDVDNRPLIMLNFGSQTEASTTLGLKSDIDYLAFNFQVNVIQDWSDWELGKIQFLMVQDETTSPGYCLLQWVRSDVPMPVEGFQNKHCFTDDRGRVLLRHLLCVEHMVDRNGDIRHGPAANCHHLNGLESDIVHAVPCLSWPKEACLWLEQHHVGGWPTTDMKRYSADHECFVVPVSSKNGVHEDLEWRISTSLAERCLMFSLNMAQMMCYILMKMVLKDCIKPKCDEGISSFMCKNVLFHCIADSRPGEWRESNLMTCLTRCLQCLFDCVLTENCPHFMIPSNNLLAGKLSPGTKQRLVDILCTLTGDIEQTLLGISIDDLGSRIVIKSGQIVTDYIASASDVSLVVSEQTTLFLAAQIQLIFFLNTYENISNNDVLAYQTLVHKVSKLCQAYFAGSKTEQAACKLVTPFLCTYVSSVVASADIHRFNALSPEALWWFSVGLSSDFSSSRLKLASALYCAGDLERCEVLLADLERRFRSDLVQNTCVCYAHGMLPSYEFMRLCLDGNEDVIKHNIAFCVRYLPCEMNCIPAELKYELFRSTVDDLSYRAKEDYWMVCAVVDSLSYLYFLQYKVYSRLRRLVDQYIALINLAKTIRNEPNLGHKETALNLLGQCMEQENRKEDAFRCFVKSLKLRRRNNAAIWHVCILVAALLRQQTGL